MSVVSMCVCVQVLCESIIYDVYIILYMYTYNMYNTLFAPRVTVSSAENICLPESYLNMWGSYSNRARTEGKSSGLRATLYAPAAAAVP